MGRRFGLLPMRFAKRPRMAMVACAIALDMLEQDQQIAGIPYRDDFQVGTADQRKRKRVAKRICIARWCESRRH